MLASLEQKNQMDTITPTLMCRFTFLHVVSLG